MWLQVGMEFSLICYRSGWVYISNISLLTMKKHRVNNLNFSIFDSLC